MRGGARGGSGCRVVLTGGPGGGKTTAADLFRRELGDQVAVVPEAATLLFSGGFPRNGAPNLVRATQKAIFHVQRGLEEAQAAAYPGRVLLCDRGTIDGAVYWPEPPGGDGEFFTALGTSLGEELARYDAVIFFESAAVGGMEIEGGNPTRIENHAEAAALDRALRGLWSQHPRFVFVRHESSFFGKIAAGLSALTELVAELRAAQTHR